MAQSYRSPLPVNVLFARVRHPQYGLGIVEHLDDTCITVEFDTGQRHTFPRSPNQLSRATWPIDSVVMVRSKGTVGVVRHCTMEQNLCKYRIELSISGSVINVLEGGISDRDSGSSVVDPLEGLLERRFDHPRLFYARMIAHYLDCSRQTLVSTGATARIDPRPHQISVARRVVTAPRPRFLLADEVGLGKTIEAGLVIQELRARGVLQRVLVVVPANLTYQWCTELDQKFNERFTVYDANVVRQLRIEHPGRNPWLARNNIILSHGYIEHNERLWDEIAAVPWDMVVVDEAHHVRRRQTSGDRREATLLYRFASRLSERTRGLLLLTATPMQLQTFELFSLIELLDCGLFYNYDHFEEQRQANRIINTLIRELDQFDREGETPPADLPQRVHTHLDPEHHPLVDQLHRSAVARQRLIDLLSERHLLSEVMIRNRKRVIGEFTRRRPHIIPVELSPAERTLYDSVTRYVRESYQQLDQRRRGVVGFLLVAYQRRLTSCTYAFRRTIDRRLQKLRSALAQIETMPDWSADEELDDVLGRLDQIAFGTDPAAIMLEQRELERLRSLALAIRTDNKYAAFEQFLAQLFAHNPGEQVLIFTQFYDTLVYLQGQLSRRWRTATFHGGMNTRDKDSAIEMFRSGAAQILISTEAGGEGRNLQFCSVLVNYDLPWNPMKVEQRIGRIDRIGQKRDVLICNFALRGTVEDRVLDMLAHRIHIFEETVGGLDPILGELEADIQRIILETPTEQVDRELERRGEMLELEIERARQAEEAQRDFVIDLRSFNRQIQVVFDAEEQQRLLNASREWSTLMLRQVGAHVEPQPEGWLHVQLGKRSGGILPEVSQRFFDITFDYHQAMESQRLEYGSFGHPLFDALIAYGTSDAFACGTVTQRTIASDSHDAFSGYQFNFLITELSVQTTRSLVVVAVDDDGIYRPDLSSLLIESRDWETPTPPASATDEQDWGARVERAYDVAQDVLAQILQERLARRKAELEPAIQAEEQRINRYAQMRLRSGQAKLQHDLAILEKLQRSSREEDRRVIPIWRRNVENAEAYLRTIAEERDRQLKELSGRRHVTYDTTLLSTARVTVVVPMERPTSTISFQKALSPSPTQPVQVPSTRSTSPETHVRKIAGAPASARHVLPKETSRIHSEPESVLRPPSDSPQTKKAKSKFETIVDFISVKLRLRKR